jgi:hypothetical protein
MTTKSDALQSLFVYARDAVTGEITKVAVTADMQIGLAGHPVDLQLLGRFSVNVTDFNTTHANNGVFQAESSDTIISVNVVAPVAEVVINLPNDPRDGQLHFIKDTTGTAAISQVVYVATKGYFIDGNPYGTISTMYGSVLLAWFDEEWHVMVSGGGSSTSGTVYADLYGGYGLLAPNANDPNARLLTGLGGTSIIDLGPGNQAFISSSIYADVSASYVLVSGSNVEDPNARIISGSGGTSILDQGPGGKLIISSQTFNVGLTGEIDFYGDGVDGDNFADGISTVAGTTFHAGGIYELVREVMYRNLTVSPGIVIWTGGFRMFVQNILTNNGSINANGGNGLGVHSAGGLPGGLNTTVSPQTLGIGSGGGGGLFNTSGGSLQQCVGGQGGAGNGNIGGPLTGLPAGSSNVHNLLAAVSGRVYGPSNGVDGYGFTFNGGTGGGPSGTGGTGFGSDQGDGGGGGGINLVMAYTLQGSGVISADGGNGYSELIGSPPPPYGTGTGGGGGGYCSVVTHDITNWSGIITANGGLPGYLGIGHPGSLGAPGIARLWIVAAGGSLGPAGPSGSIGTPGTQGVHWENGLTFLPNNPYITASVSAGLAISPAGGGTYAQLSLQVQGLGGVSISTGSTNQIIISGSSPLITNLSATNGLAITSAGSLYTVSGTVGADAYASYVLTSGSANDPRARRLVGGTNISLVDNGPGNTLVVGFTGIVSSTIAAFASSSYVVVALDAENPNERFLNGAGGTSVSDAGPGGAVTLSSSVGADRYASYALVTTDPNNPQSRTLAAGTNVTLTDGGPGSTLIISSNTSSFGIVVEQNAVPIANNPHTTLNFTGGVTVTDSGGGVANISVTGGGGGGGSNQFVDGGGKLYTTASVSIDANAQFASQVGTDIYFFASGTINLPQGNGGRQIAAFGGDTYTSGTATFVQGLTGSLTKLTNGTSYLLAGTNVSITTNSLGQVTITSTGGATNNSWVDAGNKVYTTSSVAHDGASGNNTADHYGTDNFMYVSGSIGVTTGSRTDRKVSVFAGDVVVSGTVTVLSKGMYYGYCTGNLQWWSNTNWTGFSTIPGNWTDQIVSGVYRNGSNFSVTQAGFYYVDAQFDVFNSVTVAYIAFRLTGSNGVPTMLQHGDYAGGTYSQGTIRGVVQMFPGVTYGLQFATKAGSGTAYGTSDPIGGPDSENQRTGIISIFQIA